MHPSACSFLRHLLLLLFLLLFPASAERRVECFLRATRLPLAFSSDPLIMNTEKVTGEAPAADSLINISPAPIGRSGGQPRCDGGG
ncbi:hypothetical protein EYF80_030545 [Liparis tanakae]|uniref:Uncharacterized protein n=1 Tax=Liparis tanakae TaxID=230148 RepID=A0A4Z2H1D5_9TELE|nr:hypothetical protein EYF80_030545 [Liparis tanakae]